MGVFEHTLLKHSIAEIKFVAEHKGSKFFLSKMKHLHFIEIQIDCKILGKLFQI